MRSGSELTLLILAGGKGSRYGGSKQTDAVSGNNESLMDFSIYHALRAGIRKFAFIISENFQKEEKTRLKEILNKRDAEVSFIVQKPDTFVPDAYKSRLVGRSKPLGTGHAVYCAKEKIHGPFIIINADDYYGRETFETAVAWATEKKNAEKFALTAFALQNTLSLSGGVSRGVCQTKESRLLHIEEYADIHKKENEIVGKSENGEWKTLLPNTPVSMNFWILSPLFFEWAELLFHRFLEQEDLMTQEFYLPSVIDFAINQKKIIVDVLKTEEYWFGLTWKEDKERVMQEIAELKKQGIYPQRLWTN